MAADEDFEAVKNELQMNQTKRWQAIGMLKHVFSSIDLSWELKTHALDFLFCIMDGGATVEIQNDNMDYYTYMPTLYTALQVNYYDIFSSFELLCPSALKLKCTVQAIEMVIIYAPNAVLRKKSFDALKKVTAFFLCFEIFACRSSFSMLLSYQNCMTPVWSKMRSLLMLFF